MINFYVIPTHPNYLINKRGVVINQKTNRKLKPCKSSSSGYLTVYVDGKNVLLHRLVAETFIPNLENKPCVNHIDGDKLNNNVSNLEWCTYAENNLHARKTGLNPYRVLRGEKSRHHKLKQSDVEYIKSHYIRYDKTYGAKPLSKKFNVTASCICQIASGQNWGGALS